MAPAWCLSLPYSHHASQELICWPTILSVGEKPLRVGSIQASALTQQLGPPQPTSLVSFTSTQNTEPVARTSKDPGGSQPSLARLPRKISLAP